MSVSSATVILQIIDPGNHFDSSLHGVVIDQYQIACDIASQPPAFMGHWRGYEPPWPMFITHGRALGVLK